MRAPQYGGKGKRRAANPFSGSWDMLVPETRQLVSRGNAKAKGFSLPLPQARFSAASKPLQRVLTPMPTVGARGYSRTTAAAMAGNKVRYRAPYGVQGMTLHLHHASAMVKGSIDPSKQGPVISKTKSHVTKAVNGSKAKKPPQ